MKSIEINLEDYGYTYVGPQVLKYPGICWMEGKLPTKIEIATLLHPRELRKYGYIPMRKIALKWHDHEIGK